MPRSLISILFLLFFRSVSIAQPTGDIMESIKSINTSVVARGSTAVISNRAMNVFMADKTGYAGSSDDVSFFTNYVTFNSTDGICTVNHNFQTPKGNDELLKNLFSMGFKSNINSIGAAFLDKHFDDELALTLDYKWLQKPRTQIVNTSHQQQMNALRAAIVYTLQTAIDKEMADFTTALAKTVATDIPGENLDSAKALMQQNFYGELKEKYELLFATQQATLLTKTGNFKKISFGYTSFTATIPIISPTYTVAPSITALFAQKKSYPLQLMLAHTRLWESSNRGRLFVTLSGSLLLNNSKLSYGLDKISATSYEGMGGIDTSTLVQKNKAYTGLYETFVTPAVKARILYYPTNSHVGFSVVAEQHIGKDKLLTGRIGVPIVLINNQKTPAVNVECYVTFFDINHAVKNLQGRGSRTTVGVAVGIPFSRLMY